MQKAEKPPALGVVQEPPPPVDTKYPTFGVVWTTTDAIADGPSTVEAIDRHEREKRERAWEDLWLGRGTERRVSVSVLTAEEFDAACREMWPVDASVPTPCEVKP